MVGRTAEDIDEFIEKLEATGDFDSILAKQSDRTEDGLNRAVLDADSPTMPSKDQPAATGAGGDAGPPEAGRPAGAARRHQGAPAARRRSEGNREPARAHPRREAPADLSRSWRC